MIDTHNGPSPIMTTQTATYLDAILHLPEGATLALAEVSWYEYEELVDELAAERPGVRLFYDRGQLVIMTPSARHELYKELVLRLIHEFAALKGQIVESRGATTYRRAATRQGAEPDTCFYVQHAQRIIGKPEIDLTTDPPPDVVVEIDVHHASTAKMPFYASLGVPELWRYDERQLRIYLLEGKEYVEAPESATFPDLTADLLTRLLAQSKTQGQTAALTALRESLRR